MSTARTCERDGEQGRKGGSEHSKMRDGRCCGCLYLSPALHLFLSLSLCVCVRPSHLIVGAREALANDLGLVGAALLHVLVLVVLGEAGLPLLVDQQ